MVRRTTRRRVLAAAAAGAGGLLAGCGSILSTGGDDEDGIDDWQYTPESRDANASGGPQYAMSASGSGGSGDGAESIGLATGGAKDVNTFRNNVAEGYLPIPESLPYEGLFYDYYFDTGGDGSCSNRFCPTYSPAVSTDPLSGETERYVTVGLNSGIGTDEFERPRLNLVVVLDVSGSMRSSFDDYYYDRYGNKQTPEGDTSRSKIDVATDALVTLTEQLRDDDRLGVVLFESDGALAKPLRRVGETDMDAIRDHVQEDVQAGGGTNFEAGVDLATEELEGYADEDAETVENRMIVLADAMPNLGETSAGGLRGKLEDNAADGRHTTFVGVGVDFNAELVDRITAIRGANYYSVHSAEEFDRRVGEEFAYMVTPLVFDLDLELDAAGYDIEQVYGTSAAEEATGQIMHVNTLFPSPKSGGETRGGVVLVKLDRQSADGTLTLRADWEDRTGSTSETTTTIEFPADEPEHFANSGVRKAVLLSRYADLLKNWMIDEREGDEPAPDADIAVPPAGEELGRWEQQSEPLTVSDAYETRLSEFRSYFESETGAIGDEDLEQEVEQLATILEQDGS